MNNPIRPVPLSCSPGLGENTGMSDQPLNIQRVKAPQQVLTSNTGDTAQYLSARTCSKKEEAEQSGFADIQGEKVLSPEEVFGLDKLKEGVSNYGAFLVALGLPPDFLLSLEDSDINQKCLSKILECAGKNLNITSLANAFNMTLGEGNGWETLLKAWAKQRGLTFQTPIGETVYGQELIDYLVTVDPVKRKWHELATWLYYDCHELDIIEYEAKTGASAIVCLQKTLEGCKQLTIASIVHALKTTSHGCLAEKIKQLALQKGLHQSQCLHGSKFYPELIRHLAPIRSCWQELGVLLGVDGNFLDAIEQNQSSRMLDDKQKMFKGLKKANSLGTLTAPNLVQAFCASSHRVAAEHYARIWGMGFSEISNDERWERLINDTLEHKPLTFSCIHGLFFNESTPNPFIEVVLDGYYGNARLDEYHMRYMRLLNLYCENKLDLETIIRAYDAMDCPVNWPVPGAARGILPGKHQETVSRTVSLKDLLPLINNPEHSKVVSAVATLMGIERNKICSFSDNSFKGSINTWKKILTHFPFLQTGHLKALFQTFDCLQDYLPLLPAGLDTEAPTVPLAAISSYANSWVEFAHMLQVNRELLFFLASCNLPSLKGWEKSGLPPLLEIVSTLRNNKQVSKQLMPLIEEKIFEGWKKDQVRTKLSRVLREDNCMPDRFICPLSLQPMTDPVPVITGNIIRHFSKEWLLRALEIKPENPLNRDFLTYEQVSDTPVDDSLVEAKDKWLMKHPDYSLD